MKSNNDRSKSQKSPVSIVCYRSAIYTCFIYVFFFQFIKCITITLVWFACPEVSQTNLSWCINTQVLWQTAIIFKLAPGEDIMTSKCELVFNGGFGIQLITTRMLKVISIRHNKERRKNYIMAILIYMIQYNIYLCVVNIFMQHGQSFAKLLLKLSFVSSVFILI
jgi:hypothetical protein